MSVPATDGQYPQCAMDGAVTEGASSEKSQGLLEARSPAKTLQYWTLLGMLVAGATALQILEAPLPRLLPWLKPGLSNALVLYGIIRISGRFGMTVAVVRTLLTGMFLGMLFSPTNLLSLVGAISAAFAMSLANHLFGKVFSIYGISIIGALTNNLSQLVGVGKMFCGGIPLGVHLCLSIWVAIPSGLVVAALTGELLRRTE